jgi:hypothetical protein
VVDKTIKYARLQTLNGTGDPAKTGGLHMNFIDKSAPFNVRLAEIESARITMVEASRRRLQERIVQHIEYIATQTIDDMLGSRD